VANQNLRDPPNEKHSQVTVVPEDCHRSEYAMIGLRRRTIRCKIAFVRLIIRHALRDDAGGRSSQC
jgi:hypothetical protein